MSDPQRWTVVDTVTGEVLHPCVFSASFGQHPKDAGLPGWDPERQRATRIDRQPRPDLEIWNGTAWEEVAAKVEQLLIADVKARARRLKALVNTDDKSEIYLAKKAEVEWFYGIAPGAPVAVVLATIAALSDAERDRRFCYALAEQQLRGEESIAPAIARFAAGAGRAEPEVARIEAIEQLGVANIIAAADAPAKRAAFAAIDWSRS